MRAEYRKHLQRPKNTSKLRSIQCRRAIKQRCFRKAKKDTWNTFLNSLNSRTPTKKVWDKLRKVNRNYKPRKIPLLERGGNIITSPDEIADTFVDYYANISRGHIRKANQVQTEWKKEEELPYNKPFTDRELKTTKE